MPSNLQDIPAQLDRPEEPMNLTGGIEIECLLLAGARPGSASDDNDVYRHSARMRIYTALTVPMRVMCVDCRRMHSYRLPVNDPKSTSSDEEWSNPHNHYSKWNISFDMSLSLPTADRGDVPIRKHFRVIPIEIQSRILNLTEKFETSPSTSDPGHTHVITYREEVRAVYSRLNESFNQPNGQAAREHRIVVNQTASTHVHIGNGNNGFDIETVKNVISLVVAHEMQFDSIHAEDRIGGTDLLSVLSAYSGDNFPFNNKIPCPYNHPWSMDFLGSAHGMLLHGSNSRPLAYPMNKFYFNPELKIVASKFDVASWLSLIESAVTIRDLSHVMQNKSNNSTVRLSNLRRAEREQHDGSKLTIEFRQHAATLQADETLNWIEILVSLFNYANTNLNADVQTMCITNWSNPRFNMLDLLNTLGHRAESNAYQHYSKVLGGTVVRRPYADIVESQELEAIGKFPSGDFLVPLMTQLVRNRAKTIHPHTVGAAISHKFALGGYGQFSEAYLNDGKFAMLTAAQRKYLTLGYIPAASGINQKPLATAKSSSSRRGGESSK